ncbi:DnaB-like helicase N-terminal domain-containing protein [Nakamurella sp. A5-74]|uniref:DnaB-like helicase N-terminal domain-containing protein n=1 Tax=Nakamurella sp. A5-74 TaxID=3158264 RepID=A0AAU8DKP5_9ACTN
MTAAVVDHVLENEHMVIGALLQAAPGLQLAALDELTNEDFTDLRCRFALTTARRMLAENVPVDQVTLHAFVVRHALLSDGRLRGSLALWLADRTSAVPVVSHLPWYVLGVTEQSSRRAIAEAAERVREVAVLGAVADVSTVIGVEMTAIAAALGRLRGVSAHA